ncbi:MAG: ATP-binding cassette domain-containing protein [Candidatus Nanohaloarchaea archaeon]
MIEVSHLEKVYGGEAAVDGMSFEVEEGEVFGVLGPNGAGKTTTIGMLSTLRTPTSGSATVNGYDLDSEEDEVRNSIGIVFQETALDDWLTGRENLDFHARMHDIEKSEREERMEEMLELVDLSGDADRQVEDYSGGMKRRLEIARGLMQEPEVLFLDEPTLGLDAETRRDIWDYIRDLNRRENTTVVLTTHYMEEADYLCDRVAVMREGEIAALDTPENLKSGLGGDIVTVELEDTREGVEDSIREMGWVGSVERDDLTLSIKGEAAEEHLAELVELVNDLDIGIESINLRKPSLEDVFLHLTGNRLEAREGLEGG